MCPCCGSRSPGLFPRRRESGNMDFLFLRSGFPDGQRRGDVLPSAKMFLFSLIVSTGRDSPLWRFEPIFTPSNFYPLQVVGDRPGVSPHISANTPIPRSASLSDTPEGWEFAVGMRGKISPQKSGFFGVSAFGNEQSGSHSNRFSRLYVLGKI